MTAPQRLTAARIESSRAGTTDVWISDNDGSRGGGRLILRIGPSGTRLFYFKYSHGQHVHTISIGRYNRTQLEGFVTLEQARAVARHYSTIHRDPLNCDVKLALKPRPAVPAPRQRASSQTDSCAATGHTVIDLCKAYENFLEERRSTASFKSCKCDSKNYIAPTPWGGIPANKLSSYDATALLREIRNKCSADKANRIRSLLMAAYGLAIRSSTDANVGVDLASFQIETNPLGSTTKLETASRPLHRTLTARELGRFWLSLTDADHVNALKTRAIRITLLLGGQRCLQLLRAKTTDVLDDPASLTLYDGKGRRKDPREHILPLSPLARCEVAPLLADCKELGRTYLFAGRDDDTPINNGTVTRAVDDISDALLKERLIDSRFCYRDIRRTVETRMAQLGIPKEVRAHVQSHDLGGVQNVHYNRWDFFPEKTAALERWQQYLLEQAEAAKADSAERQLRS